MSAFINEPLPRGNDDGPELVIVNPAPIRNETAAAENIAAQIRQELDIDITGDELLALLRRFLDDAGHDE